MTQKMLKFLAPDFTMLLISVQSAVRTLGEWTTIRQIMPGHGYG